MAKVDPVRKGFVTFKSGPIADSLCPVQAPGVAVHSIRVAITVQLVSNLSSLVLERQDFQFFSCFFLHSREKAQYAPQRMEFDCNSEWLVQGDPSVQWPLASKGKGKGKGRHPSPVVSALLKSQQSKVARLEAALQALGQEQSTTKTALEEDVPKPVHPQQRTAAASARVARLEAALQILGEDDPDAEPLL